jgi:thiol:disulfide interchange protein
MILRAATLQPARRSAVWALAWAALTLAGCEVGVERPPQADTSASEAPLLREGTSTMTPVAPKNPRIARGSLNFVEGYRSGQAQAVSEGKPMLVFFTAQWCHYCHQMAQESFTHPQVVALAQRFVCVLVDADAEGDICQQFQVTGYPTIQFVSPRGTPLMRLVGKKPGHQLMMAMQSALQSTARRDDATDDAVLR